MLDRFTYELGDEMDIYGCGDDGSGQAVATVIYVDKKFAIAYIPCASWIYAVGLNLDPNIYYVITRDEAINIIGERPEFGEHDVFIDLNRSFMPAGETKEYFRYHIYDKNGETLSYNFIENKKFYISPCGCQAVDMIIMAKLLGEPAEGQMAFPVDEYYLKDIGLSSQGNYYWISTSETKQYDFGDWVEIENNEGDNIDNSSCIEGNVVYSCDNIAVIQVHEGFSLNIEKGGFKLISYDELSKKHGFVPFFVLQNGDVFVELKQATGETDEIFMHHDIDLNGTTFPGKIEGYLYDGEANLLGRILSLDVERQSLPFNVKEKTFEEYTTQLMEAFKDNEIPATALLWDRSDAGRKKFYYFPLLPDEKVGILY